MSLPTEIQRQLCLYYGLDGVPDVAAFIDARPHVLRERVLVVEEGDGAEVRVELPAAALGMHAIKVTGGEQALADLSAAVGMELG